MVYKLVFEARAFFFSHLKQNLVWIPNYSRLEAIEWGKKCNFFSSFKNQIRVAFTTLNLLISINISSRARTVLSVEFMQFILDSMWI